ncbi:MAG TPA: hypothetical protein VNO30_38725 [Kofleriaceae bacterium]|nr:hypothetical protein [Kofleriaceae bacterium]
MSLRRPLGRSLAAATLAAALAAAASCADEPGGPSGPPVTSGVTRKEIPVGVFRQLDLLFVIDSSPSMAAHRARLLADYRRFMEVLEAYAGGLPDVHIGVVTTDLGTRAPGELGPGRSVGTGAGACSADGDRGELRRAPAVDGNFISDVRLPDGTRSRSYTGSLADAFVQLADVGAAGCAYARPLEAARRALTDNPANTGFLRKDAYLAVVLITADEDCSFGSSLFVESSLDRSKCTAEAASLMPVAEYVAALQSIKPDHNKLMVLGGYRPAAAPACADTRPSARLDAFLAAFPSRNQAVSICEPDLSELMEYPKFLEKVTLGVACFDAPLVDVDPSTAGLQAECASWYRYHGNDGVLTEDVIPACRGDAPGPCWKLTPDPANCFEADGSRVDFRDPRSFGLGADPLAIIECVTAR